VVGHVAFFRLVVLAWAPSWVEGKRGNLTEPPPMGVPGGGGGGGFTVGQYRLIVKINGTNSVNFVGNSVNFVGNMLSNRNFS
jgi:hypothetical protein